MKTIDDVTYEDLITLVEAARELYLMSLFEYWENCGEDETDPSVRNAIERMRAALEQIGLPPVPYEEFRRSLETELKTGPTPEVLERLRALDAARAEP